MKNRNGTVLIHELKKFAIEGSRKQNEGVAKRCRRERVRRGKSKKRRQKMGAKRRLERTGVELEDE